MTYTDERIDSREILAELRDILSDPSWDHGDDPADAESWTELDTDEQERAQTLTDLLNELPESTVDSPTGNSWGCTLIREDCFEDYARELAEDIGSISPDNDWPLTYIDWPRAAAALQMDYTTVELDGTTYYAR